MCMYLGFVGELKVEKVYQIFLRHCLFNLGGANEISFRLILNLIQTQWYINITALNSSSQTDL